MGDDGDDGSSIGDPAADAIGDDPTGDLGDMSGSLGGNLSDMFGENSATMGGVASMGQTDANADVASLMGDIGSISMDGSMTAMDVLQNLLNNKPLMTLASLAVPGLAPVIGIANMAVNQGQGSGQVVGSTMGGIMGNAIAPGIGGVIGSSIGGQVGGQAVGSVPGMSATDISAANAAAADPGNSAGMGVQMQQDRQLAQSANMDPWMGGLAGLASIFDYAKTNRDSKNLQNSLGNMFGPNSPYAQQLYGQLRAKDAASGRRSDYAGLGARLQAGLAGPTAQMQGTLANIMNQRNQNRNQMMTNLFGIMKMMGGPRKIGQDVLGGLQGMFNNNGAANGQWDVMPQGSSDFGGGGDFSGNGSWDMGGGGGFDMSGGGDFDFGGGDFSNALGGAF